MEYKNVECDGIWMEHIHSGQKKIEGRVNKGKFKIGEVIRFHAPDQKLWVICKIIDLHEMSDFGKMYEKFGQKLLPGVESVDAAIAVYDQWFKESVKIYGAVGIEFVILDKSY
jgi:ASC-1-like (ASCH) protein